MRLHLLGQYRDVAPVGAEPGLSRHTGLPLRNITLDLRVGSDLADDLRHELESACSPDNALRDDEGGLWRVKQHSSSGRDWGAWSFAIELAENENPQAQSLELHGMSLVPLFYKESVTSDGVLLIYTEVQPEVADSERIEDLLTTAGGANRGKDPVYFPVRRVGVTDEPLSARWGRCLWQALPDGGRRHSLILVGEDGDHDVRLPVMSHDPELGNAIRISIRAREYGEALLDELVATGALSLEAVARVRDRVESALDRRFRDAAEARDLSEFR